MIIECLWILVARKQTTAENLPCLRSSLAPWLETGCWARWTKSARLYLERVGWGYDSQEEPPWSEAVYLWTLMHGRGGAPALGGMPLGVWWGANWDPTEQGPGPCLAVNMPPAFLEALNGWKQPSRKRFGSAWDHDDISMSLLKHFWVPRSLQ